MIGEPRSCETGRVALVTGANSGIGFEASAQLAAKGFRKVILGCRSFEKAELARMALRERTGLDVFVPLEIDVAGLPSVRRAASRLAGEAGALDVLILNAGVLPGSALVHTADGIEQTAAVSLVGHHVLTRELLQQRLLSPTARIVIAGSEGARGDAPGMKPTDLKAFARKHHSGNIDAAIRTLLTMRSPARHHWSTTYCTAKALVALWAKALAPQLPSGMTVNAVSPGNVPATNAGRHQPWWFRAMLRMASVIGPSLGLAVPASVGAQRYLAAIDWGDGETGAFWASPKGKLVGALTKQAVPELSDGECAAACWRVLETLTDRSLR